MAQPHPTFYLVAVPNLIEPEGCTLRFVLPGVGYTSLPDHAARAGYTRRSACRLADAIGGCVVRYSQLGTRRTFALVCRP